MFGIIWGTIIGIGSAISGGKQAKENKYSMDKSIEYDNIRIKEGKVPNSTYWKLKNGKYGEYNYDGKQICHSKAPNGDHLITDLYKEHIYRNITEEQKQLNFNINKQNAKQDCIAVSTGLNGMTYYGKDKRKNQLYIDRGIEYRNIDTCEKYYVVRLPLTDPEIEINKKGNHKKKYWTSEWIEFYINEAGKLVCITDKEKENNPSYTNRDDIINFINFFNSLQREKNGGWHKLIRDNVPSYISNDIYVKYYFCRELDYHSVYELKKENNNKERDLLEL